MLEFRYPDLNDKQWAKEALNLSQYMGCEYCFGNIFIWSPIYKTKITRYKEYLITKADGGRSPAYCCPVGEGDVEEILSVLIDDARRCGHPFKMFGITAECVAELERLFPGKYTFTPYRDGFDYIYNTEDLIHLAGKKYHGKRNHIAAFEKNNAWSFEAITRENIHECRQMNETWATINREKSPRDLDNEMRAINLAFDHFFDLDFVGGLLRVDGRAVAFTIGEKLNDTTFCTHIEKAYPDIRGAYPMINREFAARCLSQYQYINREEDTGAEGLRKAKLSYYPTMLLEKYNAFLRGDHD